MAHMEWEMVGVPERQMDAAGAGGLTPLHVTVSGGLQGDRVTSGLAFRDTRATQTVLREGAKAA